MIFPKRRKGYEAKLFFTFFLIFLFFVHWENALEYSLFDITVSIVDHGKLDIDENYDNMADRSYYDGHYYSNKAPGGAFLACPVYTAWKLLYFNLFPDSFIKNHEGSEYKMTYLLGGIPAVNILGDPGFFHLSSLIIVTTFTSILLSSIAVVLIYKISLLMTGNDKRSILAAFAYGLGTMALHYSTSFTTNGIGTFFVLASFYLLFSMKTKRQYQKSMFFLSGCLSGFAFVCDYWTIAISSFLMLYAICVDRKRSLYFVPGVIAGLIPLLIYNFIIFGTPFDSTFRYQDPEIWTLNEKWEGVSSSMGFSFPPDIFVFIRLLFYPYRGLFVYSPILLLSIFGLHRMYRKYREETIFICCLSLALVILNSAYWYWWSGVSYGPRFLLPIVPFLILPLNFFEYRHKGKIIAAFLFVSILINLSGLQAAEEVVAKDLHMTEEYSDRMGSFGVLYNSVTEHYLPNFLEYGPRSRILEHLLRFDTEIDIRSNFSKSLYRGGPLPFFKDYHIPFLSIFIPLFFVMIVWKDELKDTIGRTSRRGKILVCFGALMIAVSILTLMVPIEKKSVALAGNFCTNGRYAYQDSTLIVFNSDEKEIMDLSFYTRSECERDAEIFVNGRLCGKIFMEERWTENMLVFESEAGENEIVFHAAECPDGIPEKTSRYHETPLWEFIYADLNRSRSDSKDLSLNMLGKWYPEDIFGSDLRWVGDNFSIAIYNPLENDSVYSLSFFMKSHHIQRGLEIISQDGIRNINISNISENFVEIPITLSPGKNIVNFATENGCETTDDGRCLSFLIRGIGRLPNDEIILASGWYREETNQNGSWRWMGNESEIRIINSDNHPKDIRLELDLNSFGYEREIEIMSERSYIFTVPVPGKTFQVPVRIGAGVTELNIVSRDGCDRPSDISESDDTRCLSFLLNEVRTYDGK